MHPVKAKERVGVHRPEAPQKSASDHLGHFGVAPGSFLKHKVQGGRVWWRYL